MPESQGNPSQTPSQGSSRGRSNHGRRGGRNGRGPRPKNGPSEGSGDAPALNGTSGSAAPTQQNPAREPNQRSRGGRNRSSKHQIGVSGSAPNGARPAGRRAFGGHLTSATEENGESSNAVSSSPASLSADAPEFVPGQPVVSRSKVANFAPSRPKQNRPKLPKSTAADLATRIHEDISNANYECTVCTDEVLRTSHVWSCTLCWTVVHMKCAKKWHSNQMKKEEPQSAQMQNDSSWRCPACNSKLSDDPGTLMGPEQSCFCGKNSSRKLCRETDYENGWSCQDICGDLLPCGEHMCEMPCHSGLCGECPVRVDATCFCGRVSKEIPCSQRDDAQESYSVSKEQWFEGTFSCQTTCQRKYDCGQHECSQICHAQDENPAHCPFAPDVVSHCPCGKTSLSELPGYPRTSCEETIPHCDKICEKKLPCGHLCKSKCHAGGCGSCLVEVDVSCRCGRTSEPRICHEREESRPTCARTCGANMSCGRHKCTEICCTGEKRATERQAARRRNRNAAPDTAVEAEHICIRTCGRALKCGSHNCQQICHRGPCASCPEAIFTEISCDCGRTVLQPPQPCGTVAPECRFNCLRRPECGHPPVEHHCHPEEAGCPKCPFLVEKWCACGKEKLHSQPCHLQEARCGKPCGKKLKCGLHFCKKLCHRPGDCEDAALEGGECGQTCGKVKMFCEHRCQNSCHGQTPCNETSACSGRTEIACPCGIRKQEVRCLASSSNPEPTRPELKCDDECLRQERNRRLAAALNIDPATHTNDHVPYSDETLALFKETPTWCETQEREFRVFSQSPTEIRIRYKPMPSHQRRFLHVLAEDYGLESRSEDNEPFRYVLVYKGPRFVSAPSKTIAQCVKIRATQEAATAALAAAAVRPPVPNETEPLNAFLLTSPRFGLTTDEVGVALAADLSQQPSLHFKIEYLPSDEVLMRATVQYSSFMSAAGIETALRALKKAVADRVRSQEIAGNVFLCHVDASDAITRREDFGRQDGVGGWSAVAGRAAAKKESAVAAETSPVKGSGRRLLGLRKKRVEQPSGQPWASQLDGDVEC
ncbi:hypothetical protein PWT90_07157 [Aphanocladium album]|nr:hypothetical protein PWT90_07157 [Aphanocladium album]